MSVIFKVSASRMPWTNLLNMEMKTARAKATLLARLASAGRLAPSKFPIRLAAAFPPLNGNWKRIEEKDKRTELTASSTVPRLATMRPQTSCIDAKRSAALLDTRWGFVITHPSPPFTGNLQSTWQTLVRSAQFNFSRKRKTHRRNPE
jgi:hypothetical protein